MNAETFDPDQFPLHNDELEVLAELVPLQALSIIELGCGSARLARELLGRYPRCRVTGLEVDVAQHAKNLVKPQAGLSFVAAGAQSVPFPDAWFDGAMMLKSLHHVPVDAMDQALDEVARVVRPGGFLYVSEPVYGGTDERAGAPVQRRRRRATGRAGCAGPCCGSGRALERRWPSGVLRRP